VLDAHCEHEGKPYVMRIQSGDPIFPDAPPPSLDSKLEARFAKDFRKEAPEWDLVREPKPLCIGNSQALIFPDFAIVHRTDPTRFWYLEIVGFWTAEYLAKKHEALRNIAVQNFIVCIDEKLDCGNETLPTSIKVVRFRKRVPIGEILDIIAYGLL
jgi:predicted nuclease of restriction endonuclease-like RecB superfamily